MPKRHKAQRTKPKASRARVTAERANPKEEEMSKDLTQYVTTKQAAEMLGGVATEHINHLILDGKVKAIKFGKAWMVYVPSLRKYRETKSPKGRPPSRAPQMQND